MKGLDYMTIFEVVEKMRGTKVKVQTTKNGCTCFTSNTTEINRLLLGRAKDTPVDHISAEDDGTIHIYGINYLDYNF